MSEDLNRLIFGKNSLERVVAVEIYCNDIIVFVEDANGVRVKKSPNKYWILFSRDIPNLNLTRLEGDLFYKYIKFFDDYRSYSSCKNAFRQSEDIYYVHEEREAAMLVTGITYYKNAKIDEIGVLAFDIESTGLDWKAPDAKVLLISNTYRKKDRIEKKLFAFDDYETDAQFFEAWCEWVREMDPSVVCGHNIYGFDFGYLHGCAQRAGLDGLRLGRFGKFLEFDDYESKVRKDGSQKYDYKNARIFGREIVDTFFLAMKYDIGRNYESYGLKPIIKYEKLEKKDRAFYDASKIRENYKNPEEWIKIKEYAKDDADDALALFYLMSPSYFYLARSVPKPFQWIINKATGSMINSFLVRAYLQEKHSIPKASPKVHFTGARTEGYPGIYHNVYKIDVASLYPSIMLVYEVFDPAKDTKGVFLQMVRYFTKERLENKKLGKETGDKYYKDMEQSQKIVINSAYGMMGAEGLNFNSPANAARVTRIGQEILTQCIDWAVNDKNCVIVNADTDSIAFCYKDHRFISEDERKLLLAEVNSLYKEGIHWEDDGYYTSFVVCAKKNYGLKTADGKIKIKGSSLKSSKTEIAFREYQERAMKLLLNGEQEKVPDLYIEYVYEILNIEDIKRFASKKTITGKVMDSKRTTEKKIMGAVGNKSVAQGDKVWVYFDQNGALKLAEDYSQDADTQKLLERLYKSTNVFKKIIDMSLIKNYKLKKAYKALKDDGEL